MCAASLPAHVPAQSLRPVRARVELLTAEYAKAAQQYRAGDVAGGAQLQRWSEKEINFFVQQLDLIRASILRPREGADYWDVTAIAGATMLHCDLALAQLDKGLIRQAFFHLDVGRRLLDLVWRPAASGPAAGTAEDRHVAQSVQEARAFARDWYRAVGGVLHARQQVTGAVQYLGRGVDRYPDDADLHLALGSVYEELAGTSLILPPDSPDARENYLKELRSVRSMLAAAERQYRAALEGDPALDEARVRLGRTLHVQERFDEAADVLQHVLDRPVAARLRYLASLFLGGVRQKQARVQHAIAAYQAAAEADPLAQASSVALAYAHELADDRATAIEILHHLAGRSPMRDETYVDAWWGYAVGQADQSEQLWLDLRRRVRQ